MPNVNQLILSGCKIVKLIKKLKMQSCLYTKLLNFFVTPCNRRIGFQETRRKKNFTELFKKNSNCNYFFSTPCISKRIPLQTHVLIFFLPEKFRLLPTCIITPCIQGKRKLKPSEKKFFTGRF